VDIFKMEMYEQQPEGEVERTFGDLTVTEKAYSVGLVAFDIGKVCIIEMFHRLATLSEKE
jgi:hypothetical protein